MYDVVIVGCGIVGAAAAYELSRYRLRVAVLEKENDVSCATSRANSGILHAGYDPRPGTRIAKLNVDGHRLATELCRKLSVPVRACGSMVIALSDGELEVLQTLRAQGEQNGVKGLRVLDGEESLRLEPGLNPRIKGSLLAPSAMIVSPWEYTLALAETAVRNGVELFLEHDVEGIEREAAGWRIQTGGGAFRARALLNAAGLHADRIHAMVEPPNFEIRPDRGQYYILDKSEGDAVSRVIFQCPTKRGKGILVSPTVHGNLIAGPNNEPPNGPEDTATTAGGLAEVAAGARRSVPKLNLRANIRNFSGIRAASERDDFVIQQTLPGFIDLAGIKSPGLTAAPAIAKLAAEMLRDCGIRLEEKGEFIDTRQKISFSDSSVEQRRRLVAEKPAYGRIVCRCETVSEGEILDCLDGPIPPRSVDGVKRRCNAGMGRCQGGFCGPRILRLLAERTGLDPCDIPQDLAGSYILTGETKAVDREEADSCSAN